MGSGLGIFGAWFAVRAMQTIRFDVPPLPPALLAATTATMAVVSLVACLLAARRAARVDPMIALRAD